MKKKNQWFLEVPIKSWINQNVFEQKITELRNKGLINNDDSSILIIDIEKNGGRDFTYQSVNVQNIDDLLENREKKDATEALHTYKERVRNILMNILRNPIKSIRKKTI